MPDIFGKIFALIIVIVALFIVPTVNLANSQDDVLQGIVYEKTNSFVDNICTRGELTQDMYLNFIKELDTTDLLYNVEIVVGHQTIVPIFADNGNTPTGTRSIDKLTYTEEVMKTLYTTEGIYEMSRGDTISVIVSNKEPTMGQQMRTLFLNVPDYTNRIYVNAGGVIRDEIN